MLEFRMFENVCFLPQINGARIEVRGSLRFVNNTPSLHGLESGSLYVFSFAQLQLFSGAELIFKNNSGM